MDRLGELTIQNHIDFVLQWFILATAVWGYYMVRRSQKRHGWGLFGATVANIAAIVVLMTPRLIVHIPEINLAHLDMHASLILLHSSIGAVAAGLSVTLVALWGKVNFRLGRCRRQGLMALSFVIWMLAAGVGIFGYLRHTFGFLP